MGVTLHTDGADPLTVEGAVWTMVGGKRRPPAVLRPARVRVLADRAARLAADYRDRADGWSFVRDREGVRRTAGELTALCGWLWAVGRTDPAEDWRTPPVQVRQENDAADGGLIPPATAQP